MEQVALQETRTRRWFDLGSVANSAFEPAPIRGELMSVERLEAFAETLARSQRLSVSLAPGRSLLTRTRQNGRVLRRHYETVAHTTSSQRSVTPAAEWFVDNYYVVERQLQLIRDDLPAGYYRQLPRLAAGELAGFPRITGIAWAFVAHTDSHFDAPLLMRFVTSYQRIQALTIGELWALASMLRVVLVENLRRSADRIVSGRAEREKADVLADRLLGSPSRAAEPVTRVLGHLSRRPLPRTLAVQLVQRLRDCDPHVTPALQYVEELLRAEGLTADEVVRDELSRQSAANVTVRNIVTSLVQLSALDWSDIVEQLSVVDALLNANSDFGSLDFATRNRYRSAIEEIARDSHSPETDIAQRALAAAAAAGSGEAAERDPGFHLIGPGRRPLERAVGYRPPLRQLLRRALRGAGITGYVTLVAVLSAALLIAAAQLLVPLSAGWRIIFLALLLVPASDVALALVNSLVTRLLKPTALPALDLAGVIPGDCRTVVAVPILLTGQNELTEALANLESQYLASARGEIYFALIADGVDAPAAVLERDEELIEAGREGIAALNERYGRGTHGDRFLWLYRSRRWNAAQGCWMGWERKRGKLHELNRLLRGATDTTFEISARERAGVPGDVRYVLVLDADTHLPHGTAEKLIAKMSHPLNQARFDPQRRRVVAGYGILQPRVTPSLPSGPGTSLVQMVFSASPGLDPYAFAVSDVYQDLVGEGSFTGKGLYEVDAFEQSLRGRIGENSVLSHDLLEGLFARAAVASDVEVVEPSPDRYDVISAREHRWSRGDWQLLPWLLPGFLRRDSERAWWPIDRIGLWKIFDNLRRTTAPICVLAGLVLAWLVLPPPWSLYWTAALIGSLSVGPLLPILIAVRDRPRHLRRESERQALRHDLRVACLRWSLTIAFLADRAWWMTDAIVRTLYRLGISKQHLLDWTTAAQSRRQSRLDIASYLTRMRASVVLALVVLGLVLWVVPENFWVAAPWLLLWLAAPWAALYVSVPQADAAAEALNVNDARELRLIARRTWAYFERFVTAADNFLPPDNFQETPVPVVAQRTSPTNVGMYLLSCVAALEFGWAGLLEWIERLERTLDALQGLERFRGHFFNWYDTRTGQPLLPRYVSTVDSGNLAGHLLTLANAIDAAAAAPLWTRERLNGIADALALAPPGALPELAGALQAAMATGGEVTASIRRLGTVCRDGLVNDAWRAGDAIDWSEGAVRCVHSHQRDVDALAAAAPAGGATLQALAASPLADAAALAARDALGRMRGLAARSRELAEQMDFAFLLKPHRMLMSIGYNVTESRLDGGDYDLLASEARLASFVAIAKRDVPARHWFRLDRRSVALGNATALLSWSGSMFEYLMPALIMRSPRGSLLDRAVRVAVRAQREFGHARRVPWGVSESAYNTRDLDQTYQYSPFGVPALGLKRGLANDTVVAPYATGLAAMVDAPAAAANFRALEDWGATGEYGFYEALDFTPDRLAEGERVAVVRAFMAHHQGMMLVGITNALRDGRMQDFFHAEASARATELLLQEKPPRSVESPPEGSEAEAREGRLPVLAGRRRLHTWRPRTPHTQLLSNGRYAVMVNAAGAGFSRCGNLAVTRWSEDSTCDASGTALFLRDCESGERWSCGYQPSAVTPEAYRVTFTEDRVEITRRDGPWGTRLQVLVSAEHDAEARRISISNQGDRTREIEVTSYCEVVLAPPAADQAHRAFSNLFVQTEFEPQTAALLAGRRPRGHGDRPVWAMHLGVVEGESPSNWEYETDRARFLGRDRSLRTARALSEQEPLSGSTGVVLDPVFSLRRRLRVAAGETVRITFWTAMGDSRAEVVRIADKCREPASFDRASTLAWTRARVQLHYLGLDPDEASLFQRLAAHLFYVNPALRAGSDLLRRNRAGPQALWAHGISGDRPIMLVEIDDGAHISLVRQLLRAHGYLTLKNLAVDLVIVNTSSTSYMQDLQGAIESLARASQQRLQQGDPSGQGSVYALRAEGMSAESRLAVACAARVALVSRRGTLQEQLDRLEDPSAEALPPASARSSRAPRVAAPLPALELYNGTGGFAADGTEYMVVLGPGVVTPMPWVNVIGQPEFGFHVSASGSGYTWALNSRENALTRWSNDAVTDPPCEIFYVRDEDSGELMCPTAAPCRDPEATYVARHGRGYSLFTHSSRALSLELLQFVPRARAFKISRLTVRNDGPKTRTLSVCAYVEWTLGSSRIATAPYLITERCAHTGALLARNPWNSAFAPRTAYLDLAGEQTEWTCDRREFLGLDGSVAQPQALAAAMPLAERAGAGLDPCAALRTEFELPPGATRQILCFLGQAEDAASAATDIQAARNLHLEQALHEVKASWERMLGKVQVATPDRSFDLLLNRWLPYQVLSCRVWARAAFYQASGAYGFRDQLQDCMALATLAPDVTRAHLLRAAGRQFPEGDVQHWWMPQDGRGVRTHISDDRVWLAYCAAHYVAVSGDAAVLDEQVPYLTGEAVPPGASDAYFEPGRTEQADSVYEHCAKALDASLAIGEHGLPLFGGGDWNDGMNLVGAQGRGESIWLGWFLCATLNAFGNLAAARGDTVRAERWARHEREVAAALEQRGWDGDWYRRGYFDDGSPLGSALNSECRIDSIAQSWAVLSGAGSPARAAHAMAEVAEHLMRPDEEQLLLFTPPFADSQPDPGYIRAYPRGIRENGGQYTHGAIWSLMAFAKLGDGDRAKQLFDYFSPIQHTRDASHVARYKLEPYAVAADIYAAEAPPGRGGWSWYTGAAGWLYRAGLESILGIRTLGRELVIEPCIPRAWRRFDVDYRHGRSVYHITVTNPFGVTNGISHAELDHLTILRPPLRVPLTDDGNEHTIRVVMG